MANHSVPNDMCPSPRDYSTSFNITESAVILTEVMGGNFHNLCDGMSLNFEGMTSKQLNTAISGLLQGMNSNKLSYINIQLGDDKNKIISR